MKKLTVCEIFNSFQGEIRPVGELVTFIRLAGCNAKCTFCDTKYSWKKGNAMSITTIKKQLKHKKVIITGGEPLLQKQALIKLFDYSAHEYYIETNGTIAPLFSKVLHYNVSPKIWETKLKDSIRPEILKQFLYNDAIFKFVVRDLKDLKVVEKLVKKIKIPKDKVYIMPEGATDKQVKMHTKKLFKEIQKRNFNLSPRLQVWLWDKKRGI